MTDNTSSATPPENKETPAPPQAGKGTQPLNQKPAMPVDPETQARLKKMLSDLRQSRKEGAPAESEKAETAAAEKSPASEKPAAPSAASAEKHSAASDKPPGEKAATEKPPASEKPAAPPAATPPASQTPLIPRPPSDPARPDSGWPEPPKSLGSPQSGPLKAPPAPAAGGTSRINPPAAPGAARPSGSGLLARHKAEASVRAAAVRTTGVTRKAPGRVATKAWRVVFQAMAGSVVKELGIDVKGLVVVGRADPDSASKPDLDLTPYNASAFGVSRQHVILLPSDDGPCIIDLNSTNGTWINGLYLEPGRKYQLRTSDRIELGSLKMLAKVIPPAEPGKPAAPASKPG